MGEEKAEGFAPQPRSTNKQPNQRNYIMIKTILKSALIGLLAVLVATSFGFAQTTDKEKAELIEKLKKDYPLQTCVVSGDKLEKSEMGDPIDYLYAEQGKAPRLVRFCCKGCIKSFKKDPAKYLKMIDEAGAKKAAGATPQAPTKDGHSEHQH
jgi:hypothetical protein